MPSPRGALWAPSLSRGMSSFQYQRYQSPPNSPGPHPVIGTEVRCMAFFKIFSQLPAVVFFIALSAPSARYSPHPCICLTCSHPSTHMLKSFPAVTQVPPACSKPPLQDRPPTLTCSLFWLSLVLCLPSYLPDSHIFTLSFVALKGAHSPVAE